MKILFILLVAFAASVPAHAADAARMPIAVGPRTHPPASHVCQNERNEELRRFSPNHLAGTVKLAAPAEGVQTASPELAALAPTSVDEVPPPMNAARSRRTPRPEQSAAFKEVLDRNQVPNQRRLFEGEGHPIDQSRRDEVQGLIRQWFTDHGVLK
jgi:hypothetical protein